MFNEASSFSFRLPKKNTQQAFLIINVSSPLTVSVMRAEKGGLGYLSFIAPHVCQTERPAAAYKADYSLDIFFCLLSKARVRIMRFWVPFSWLFRADFGGSGAEKMADRNTSSHKKLSRGSGSGPARASLTRQKAASWLSRAFPTSHGQFQSVKCVIWV